MSVAQVLFVDDEASIRATFPEILRRHGFDVTVAACVPEALDFINRSMFDVLISDLNIGEPGDGFTVVSAMRRTQPNAITFILTSYPDFETALRAIRAQVDDYVVKPANVSTLAEAIRDRLSSRAKAHTPLPTRRASDVLRERMEAMIQEWIKYVEKHSELSTIKLSRQERTDHLPALIREIADQRKKSRPERAALI